MDVMDKIDNAIALLSDRVYDINSALKKMRDFTNVLYDRKLAMIIKGASVAEIDHCITEEWNRFIEKLMAR